MYTKEARESRKRRKKTNSKKVTGFERVETARNLFFVQKNKKYRKSCEKCVICVEI